MILCDFILISFKIIKKIIKHIILMKRFNNFSFNKLILITDSFFSYL